MKSDNRPTSERIYLAVKRQILDGAFRPGDRIEAAQLAQHHLASVTPVRAALHRLAGEQLVDARFSEGFRALHVSEPGLRDLYAWNGYALLLAWQLSAAVGPEQKRRPWDPSLALVDDSDAGEAVARLFAWLADQSANTQCANSIRSLNDRLHLARRLESRLFADTVTELQALIAVVQAGQRLEVRRAIGEYHQRRILAAAALVRLIYPGTD